MRWLRGDQRDLARVGDDHLMAEVRQRSRLSHGERGPASSTTRAGGQAGQRCARVSAAAAVRTRSLAYHLPAGAERVQTWRVTIAHVEADGHDLAGPPSLPSMLRVVAAILLPWPVSYLAQGSSEPLLAHSREAAVLRGNEYPLLRRRPALMPERPANWWMGRRWKSSAAKE